MSEQTITLSVDTGSRFFSIPPLVLLLALALSLASLSGCGGDRRSYSDGDLRSTEAVRMGKILDVSDVMVREEKSLAPAVAGAAIGGLLGSYFGTGTGREILGLAGAALGGYIGYQDDLSHRVYKAMQLTIELESGTTILVVQGYTEYFVRKDRVRVIGLGEGRVIVQHE
ncbi:MAG: glycine zipper 2TM domain-containing protein [Desulfovibrio sp.]|nr:glycine zipper 2TM domain-containing protein [Desulfovibrio sp.]